MTEILVSDDLWAAIQPLLPSCPPSPKGGRPRDPDRAVLGGLVYLLRTGGAVAIPARTGAGLWEPDDVLAVAGLAAGRGMAGAPLAAGLAGRPSHDRLLSG